MNAGVDILNRRENYPRRAFLLVSGGHIHSMTN